MKKIIPFSKEIIFNEEIGEIESIALEDKLTFSDLYTINGTLTIRGSHKVNEITNDFSYELPVLISVDTKYDTKDATIDVDDFYYEIINDKVLRVKIDLLLDNLLYQDIPVISDERDMNIESDKGKSLDINFDLEKKEDELKIDSNLSGKIKDEQKISMNNDVTSILPETVDEKEYSIYRVYTVNENDTLESILDKYKVTREDIEQYNDLQNVKKGTKLIIPSTDE